MSGLRCGHPAPRKGSEVEAQDLHGFQVGAMGPCLTDFLNLALCGRTILVANKSLDFVWPVHSGK